MSQMLLHGPFCAHGVLGTPHEKEHDKCAQIYMELESFYNVGTLKHWGRSQAVLQYLK